MRASAVRDVDVPRLLAWFGEVKRPMPWRRAPAPYICWLSEIMMQQTTYQTVLPYYERFLRRFPSVESLAAAKVADVLKVWEGLGYYARARNLHQAAARVVAQGWPQTAAEWAALPGVGPYTAAALASVLNGERIPVVDGNVSRVFARYWRLDGDFSKLPDRARLAARLQPAIDRCSAVSLVRCPDAADAAGMFNQAIMELGALVCTPRNPACDDCPLNRRCQARKDGVQAAYPKRGAKKTLPVRRMTGVVIADGKGRVLLAENREGGLLKGLWELPPVESAPGHVQVFSHFRQELSVVRAQRTDARFVDPRMVPLATSTKKVLSKCGLLGKE